MKEYTINVIDTIVTEYTVEAHDKAEAEEKYYNDEAEESKQGERIWREIEVD